MYEAGNLENEALKRKERLKSLKQKKDKDHEESGAQTDSQTLPKPLFRSYRPQHEDLKEQIIPDANPANLEEDIKDQLEAAKTKVVLDELDITSLAPRKPDWDLKRDVAKKLEKLEKRTQRAIAELIMERLRERQDLYNPLVRNEN